MAILERKFVDVKGAKTAYAEMGAGPDMLLLHGGGGGCSADDFHLNIGPLAEHFHVYALDEWGFGLTEKPAADNSMPARALHTFDFMDAVGIDSAHLVGHSQGAWVATTIALDHPDRVVSNVIIDSGSVAPFGNLDEYGLPVKALRQAGPAVVLGSGREATRRILEVVTHKKERLSDAYVDAWSEHGDYPGNDKAAKERSSGGVWSPETQGKLALTERLWSLRCPTLIIWGRQDAGAPLERGLRLAELISGAEMHIFDGANHMVMIDCTEAFNQLLAAFCRAKH